MKIIMVKDNGDMETIITDEAVIVSKTEDGDFDFHGDPSPEFLKKVIDINGLGRYHKMNIKRTWEAICMWEKVMKAYEAVENGIADRLDLKEYNIVVYRAGTVIRIDFKGK